MKVTHILSDAGLNLRLEPQLLWVPLAGGDTCGVLAHRCVVEEESVHFFVGVDPLDGESWLESAVFQRNVLGEGVVLQNAISEGECELVAPAPGARRLMDPGDFWEFKTVRGGSIRILASACSLQGPHLVFVTRLSLGEGATRPVLFATMRFPLSLMPADIEDSITRNW